MAQDNAHAKNPARQKRSQRSRRDILRSARMAFARHGFEGANIRDIATEVGVTHTLIRYHFGNKSDLWKAVIDDMYARLNAAMSKDQAGGFDLRTKEGLRAWLRFYIGYCAKNPEQARIMINESMVRSERLDYMVGHIRRSHRALIPVFRHLMKDGVVPDMWLVSFFYIISTMCQMPFVLSTTIERLYGVDMTSEPAIEAHYEAVVAFMLGEPPRHQLQWPALPDWAKQAQAS